LFLPFFFTVDVGFQEVAEYFIAAIGSTFSWVVWHKDSTLDEGWLGHFEVDEN
jgi:hypothetical protein